MTSLAKTQGNVLLSMMSMTIDGFATRLRAFHKHVYPRTCMPNDNVYRRSGNAIAGRVHAAPSQHRAGALVRVVMSVPAKGPRRRIVLKEKIFRVKQIWMASGMAFPRGT